MPRKRYPRHLAGIIFLTFCLALLLPGAGTVLADEIMTAGTTEETLSDETFIIKFMNYSKTELLQTMECVAGKLPVYTNNTPSKRLPSGHTYTFAGWQPEIVPAVADAVYTPIFDVSTTFTLSPTLYDGYVTVRQVLPDTYPQLDPGVQAVMTLCNEQYNILTTVLAIDGTAMPALAPAGQVILRTQQGDIAVSNALLGYLEGLGTNITIQASTVTAQNEAAYAKLTAAQQTVAAAADICLDIAFMQGVDVLLLAENDAAETGSFTVTLPYELSDATAQPVVSLIAGDGTAARIPAVYSEGSLTFTTAQSGCYAITEEIVTEDAFTIALEPMDEAISAGQEFVCRAVLTQTAKTPEGGSVQTFTIPVAFDPNLTWTGFSAAEGLGVTAWGSGSTLTLTYTDAANGFSLDSGESIALGEVTFRAPQEAGLFTAGAYMIADISIAAGSNEIAVSGRQYGVPAQAAASAAAVVHRVTVTFPGEMDGYSVTGVMPGEEVLAVYGQAFSFEITPLDGYAAPIVSVGGQVVAPGSSAAGVYTYTLPEITDSVTVDIEPVAAEYSITYMDGSEIMAGMSPMTYEFGIGAALPGDAGKPGYVLAGWYADAACSGQAVKEIGTAEFGDKVFYAKWAANPLVLTESTYTAALVKGEAMPVLDLADFIADDGGAEGEISIALAAGSALPDGLALSGGCITGAPQQAGESTAAISFTSPTGAAAELVLTFSVQDIVPLTVNFAGAVADPADCAIFMPLDGYVEQDGQLYVPVGEELRFSAVVDVGYVLTVSAASGGESCILTPDEAGVYTIPAGDGGGSLTVTLQVALDSEVISIFAPTREDVTGGGRIFQPFSVYSGGRVLVLFNVRDAAVGGLTLSDGTEVYATAHYNGYTHAALLDLTGCPVDGLAEHVARLLGTGAAANRALVYDMDVNGSGAFSVTDISVLYDFTSRTALQWRPEDELLLVGDHDAGMSLDAADVAVLVAAYAGLYADGSEG